MAVTYEWDIETVDPKTGDIEEGHIMEIPRAYLRDIEAGHVAYAYPV